MKRFSSAMSTMNLSEFQPSVASETKQSDTETAEEAEISRLRQIQDGLDFWDDRSRHGTGSGFPTPG
jgi:hypothetical protein